MLKSIYRFIVSCLCFCGKVLAGLVILVLYVCLMTVLRMALESFSEWLLDLTIVKGLLQEVAGRGQLTQPL